MGFNLSWGTDSIWLCRLHQFSKPAIRWEPCVFQCGVPLHECSCWFGCPCGKWPITPWLLPSWPHRLVSRSGHKSFEVLSECHILGLLRQVLQADIWYSDGVPCVGHSGRLSNGVRPLHISNSTQVLETLHRRDLYCSPPDQLPAFHRHLNSIEASNLLLKQKKTTVHRKVTHRQISRFPIPPPPGPQDCGASNTLF